MRDACGISGSGDFNSLPFGDELWAESRFAEQVSQAGSGWREECDLSGLVRKLDALDENRAVSGGEIFVLRVTR